MKPWLKCDDGIKTTTPNASYYKEFGIFKINTRYLPRNILIAKYKNCSGPINKLKQTQISPPMRIILSQIMDGKTTIDELYYSTLPVKEKGLLYYMLKRARLIDSTNYRDLMKELPDQLRVRFDIIKGELEAGNNNDLLIEEAKDVITAMNYIDLLSNKHYKELIEELN